MFFWGKKGASIVSYVQMRVLFQQNFFRAALARLGSSVAGQRLAPGLLLCGFRWKPTCEPQQKFKGVTWRLLKPEL